MIVLGIILLVIGFLVPSLAVLKIIGGILIAVGLILMVLGAAGREIGGRRHWY